MKKYERLAEKPIPGKLYYNAGSYYKITSPVDSGEAVVVRPKDGYTLTAHGLALYRVDGDHIALQWDYSTGGRFAKNV